MPNNMENISIVTRLLKANGINHVVISPGGTNIAFIKALQNDPFFTCHSVVDERSAAYFAIGIYLQTGIPVALCCTSAQATRNYVPGLTEAYYKRVPLFVISMQKHPRFTYQEYMQAPDQGSLPADSVKKSFTLPYISDVNDVYHNIRMANQAIQELTHNGFGPVQLCVPWLDFPLGNEEPILRCVQRHGTEDCWNLPLKGKKVMVVIGEHRPFNARIHKLINDFCERWGAVVYANLLSNFHSPYCVATNMLMSSLSMETFGQMAPDIMITIGGQTGDYPLYRMISKPEFASIEHWRIAEDGNVVDTYDKLTEVFQCSEDFFFERACSVEDDQARNDDAYIDQWRGLLSNVTTRVQVPFSNAAIAQYMSSRIPVQSTIQLSILNSLRVWELFTFDDSITFFSNVGAFGIDGGMSTLIGQSFATEDLCIMVTGDLAFLYDINSLSIRGVKPNVRILLINNNGGFEFKLGVGHDEDVDRYIAAGGHFKTASGWASDCGFTYMSASSMDEFEQLSEAFLADSSKPVVLEVFVSDDNENEAYQRLIEANQMLSFSESVKKRMKQSIKRVIGAGNARQAASLFTGRK